MIVKKRIDNEERMIELGRAVGQRLRGGEVLQLISDLGGGKTTLTKGIAEGVGSEDDVASPTFTVSREYQGDDLRIHHYDFYRLDEIGLMAEELSEVLGDEQAVCVIEWTKDAAEILPEERTLTVTIDRVAEDEDARDVVIDIPEKISYLGEVVA